MKSHALTLVGLLAASLILAACGTPTVSSTQPASSSPKSTSSAPIATSSAPTTSSASTSKFFTYKGEQFLAEDWDKKTIAYQFVSSAPYQIADYNIKVDAMINLYSDGSFLADQRNDKSSQSFWYFGAWAATVEEGYTTLTVKTLFMKDGEDDTVAHVYSYKLVESSSHTFKWTFDFAMMVHQYFRTVDMEGSATAKYATWADFHAVVDVIEVGLEFEGTVNETTSGLTTVRLLGLSNGVGRLYAYLPYSNNLIRLGKWENGVFSTVKDNTNGATTSAKWDFTASTSEITPASVTTTVSDGTYSDISLAMKWTSNMGTAKTFDVTVTLKKVDVNVSITGETPTAASSASAA